MVKAKLYNLNLHHLFSVGDDPGLEPPSVFPAKLPGLSPAPVTPNV